MKKGFTLAELLVTLGLLGVIAALTLPGFVNNAVNAKIGPSLAKAVATFDQANKALFNDKEIEALSDEIILGSNADVSKYWEMLSDYMVINRLDNSSITTVSSEEGFSYDITPKSYSATAFSSTPYLQELTECIVDINGDELPNEVGTDQFYFKLMNDGSLQPYGVNGAWKSYCPVGGVPSDYKYCSGHIFENGLKVLYE